MQQIRGRYPPVKFEAVDRDTGEIRRFELDYSKLLLDDAYVFQREIEWAITTLFQWRDLVHKMTGRGAEDAAAELRKAEKQ